MISLARKSKKKKARAKSRAKPVKPIPSGFRSVTPYLILNNASGAIDFYKKAFGAKELNRFNTPDGKILNAQIRIGDSIVMLNDEFPQAEVKSPASAGTSTVVIHVYSRNVDKLFGQAVSAGAKVTMPLDNQFWGERYGQLVDPFGHHWSLSQAIRMSAKEKEEKQKAAMAMFAQGGPAEAAGPPAEGTLPPPSP